MIARLLEWLRLSPARATDRVEPPLRGIPPVRRLKTYAADTGYSWSYFYEGYRVRSEPLPGRGYEFTLHRGSVSPRTLVVVVPDAVAAGLAESIGRPLGTNEVYALAKLHLFSVLDREPDPASASANVLSADSAREIWERLGL